MANRHLTVFTFVTEYPPAPPTIRDVVIYGRNFCARHLSRVHITLNVLTARPAPIRQIYYFYDRYTAPRYAVRLRTVIIAQYSYTSTIGEVEIID